jgi:hypothetical protein
MRKRYRVLILATLVAALVVPVGFALSLESPMPVHSSVGLMASAANLQIPDSAGLFVVGATLIGLAAFVRKRI